MIYASERDAKLGWTIGANAMWRQAGATGVREFKIEKIDCGTAVLTVAINLRNVCMYVGTSVNMAVPLPFRNLPTQQPPEPTLTSPAEMVEELREVFGLNVTQLAQVLNIERITVYAWLRTDRMEKLNPTNRNRLWRLYQLAKQWKSYASLGGKYLVEPVPGRNTTLLQMLCAPQVDPGDFAQAYELLARAISPSSRAQIHRAEQSQSLKKGIENLRKNAHKFGMDLS